MNAGKSTLLLQKLNYRERGMKTLILQPEVDVGTAGRVALELIECRGQDVFTSMKICSKPSSRVTSRLIHCVLVDEAQFLTGRQIRPPGDVYFGCSVLAYGLRTVFRAAIRRQPTTAGHGQTVWWRSRRFATGRKATMVLRIGATVRPYATETKCKLGQ